MVCRLQRKRKTIVAVAAALIRIPTRKRTQKLKALRRQLEMSQAAAGQIPPSTQQFASG